MTSPHVFKYNRWYFCCTVSPLRHPPPKKMFPVLTLDVKEGSDGQQRDMATVLVVKWGGEFWCCACLRDHRPRLTLQQHCGQIWAGWMWAQSRFSVLFSPLLHCIYTNPLICSKSELTTKRKHCLCFPAIVFTLLAVYVGVLLVHSCATVGARQASVRSV